ncbi:MAG: hypothetical protein PXZ07_00790 [Candidatus Eremiobacteraeota bacterium]|nr:hypothetical protein [Candidatus Eremiobacteraeota bacterium]
MISCLPRPPEITKSLDELQRAEERIRVARERQRWSEWLAAQKAAVPTLLAIADLIEASWLTIAQSEQEQIVRARNLLGELIASQPEPKNLVARIARVFVSVWIAAQQSELIPFAYALVRFMVAVDRALAHEARHLAWVDERFLADTDARAAIQQGDSDTENGRGHRFSVEEFRERFIFG